MSNTSLLLTIILIQQGLLAAVWIGAASQGLERRAAMHWGLATLLITVSLTLVVLRAPGMTLWQTHFLPCVCAVAAYVLWQRGVQLFCGRMPTDRAHAALLAAAGVVLVVLIVRRAPLSWIASATMLPMAWLLVASGVEAGHRLRGEFGALPAWVCATPMLLLAGAFGARGALAPFDMEQAGKLMAAPGRLNAQYGLLLMTLSLLMNLGLGALVFKRTVNQLRLLSDHDMLTGLLNRRGLEPLLLRERNRLQRDGGGYALLSLDIDHFKRINDQFGHDAGDATLVAIAQRLTHGLRPADAVARTGGEEFCVVLPGVDADRAGHIAERVLDSVRTMSLQWGGRRIGVTASIGVAVVLDPHEPRQALARRLDQALYRAKDAGRDRMMFAGATGDETPVVGSMAKVVPLIA